MLEPDMSQLTVPRPSPEIDLTPRSRCLSLAFDAGDTNFYRYALNNPANATDPSGRKIGLKADKTEVTKSSTTYVYIHHEAMKFESDKLRVSEVLDPMIDSDSTYSFEDAAALLANVKYRMLIVHAAYLASTRKWQFAEEHYATFVPSKHWDEEETNDKKKGITVREGEKPSDAVRELYLLSTGTRFKCECATSVIAILLRARLDYYVSEGKEDLFNAKYGGANLDRIAPFLGSVVQGVKKRYYGLNLGPWGYGYDVGLVGLFELEPVKPATELTLVPGDLRAFVNPDAVNPSWRRENVVYLGRGMFYAHPWGAKTEEEVGKLLDKEPKQGDRRKAKLDRVHAYDVLMPKMNDAK
jgi:hypothetical protein